MKPPVPVLHVAEPPAHYLVRPPLVVDCSALAALVFEESTFDEARTHLAGRVLHAPYLLQVEIASVALKKSRLGEAHAEEGLARAAEMAIELHSIDIPGVAALAERYGLSAYDAAYLWVAEHLKAPLVTFDAQLAKVARQHLSALD